MSSALPYILGGLAGGAVPGLGQGVARGMVMQQAFEREQKRDTRYDEEKAFRAESQEYSRGRDTAGDLERKAARELTATNRGKDLEIAKEGREWHREFALSGVETAKIEREYQHKRQAIADAQTVAGEKRAATIFSARMDSYRRSDAEGKIKFDMWFEKASDELVEDGKEKEFAKTMRMAVAKEFGISTVGMPLHMAETFYTSIIDKKPLDFKALQEDFMDLSEAANDENLPDGERAIYAAMAGNLGAMFEDKFGVQIWKSRRALLMKENQEKVENLTKAMVKRQVGRLFALGVGGALDIVASPAAYPLSVMRGESWTGSGPTAHGFQRLLSGMAKEGQAELKAGWQAEGELIAEDKRIAREQAGSSGRQYQPIMQEREGNFAKKIPRTSVLDSFR